MFRIIRKWLKSSETATTDTGRGFDDVQLGQVRPAPREPNAFVASVPFNDGQVDLIIDPEFGGVTLDESLPLARTVADRLEALIEKARIAAADALCETYNSSWREYDEKQADGSFKEATMPELSPNAFGAALGLTSVAVRGTDLEFFFDDGGLFAGHSVVVSTFDGLDFEKVDAQLFG